MDRSSGRVSVARVQQQQCTPARDRNSRYKQGEGLKWKQQQPHAGHFHLSQHTASLESEIGLKTLKYTEQQRSAE